MQHRRSSSVRVVLTVLIVPVLFRPSASAAADTNRMPEVVVTAARLPEEQMPVTKMPANVTVIDRAQIESAPSFALTELLRQQVGLVAADTVGFGAGGNLVMRGFGERAGMVILVDGVRVNDAGDATSPFLWNSVPLNSIERIEVIRGGASTVYGEGAVGGVINIITKKPTDQPVTATATAAGGNLGYYTGHFDGSLKQGIFDCYVSGDRQEWEGWRDWSAFRGWSAIVKPSVNTAIGKFTLGYYFHDEISQNPGNLTAAQLAANPRQAGAYTSLFESHENRGSLDYFKSLDNGLTLAGKVYGQGYTTTSTYNGSGFSSLVNVQQPNYGGTLQASYDSDFFGRPNKLTLGMELVQQDLLSTSSDNWSDSAVQRADNWTVSVFSQDTYQLTSQLSLSGGVRYDHREWDIHIVKAGWGATTNQFPKEADAWSPKATLTYEFAEKTASWLSLSRSYHLPAGNDILLAGVDPVNGQRFISNPSIQPSISNEIEIGARCQRYNLLGGSLTYYYNHTHDDILFDPATSGNNNFDVNRQGVELTLTSRPADWVDFYYTTAYTKARYDGGDYSHHRLPLVPEWQLTGGANWRPIKNGQLTLEAVHVRGQMAINDVYNVSPDNQYVVLNARASYRWNRLTVFAKVNNLLNRLYETYPAYSSSSGVQKYNPVAGISFQAGATIVF